MGSYVLHPDSIRTLFDRVAPSYDFLNHFLSLGRDLYWRKAAVEQLGDTGGWILDLATGTGDIAMEVVRRDSGRRKVIGLDFSKPMLRRARRKLRKKKLSPRIVLGQGDALFLPFRDETFSASLIAFGLRNILEKERALSEMVRVTREGGRVIVLEFTLPEAAILKRFYSIYLKSILPWIGGLISGDSEAYSYLWKSVSQFSTSRPYEEMMKQTGLVNVSCRTLTGGIASLMVGTKRTR